MARLEEGDPRWLVSDRADGKNVNNWHWSEKNMFQWAKEKITSLCEGATIVDNDTHVITLTKVDSMKGDVTINVRKGKKLFIWDFNLTLLWKGKIKATDVEGKGKIECLDINVTDDDFDISISTDNETSATQEFRLKLKQLAYPCLKTLIKQMTDELVQSFGDAPLPNTNDKESVKKEPTNTVSETKTSSGQSVVVSSIDMKLQFKVPPHILYETLTDSNRISVFTGSHAVWSLEKGSEFKIFGGAITGTQVEYVENEKIVQKWRFGSWPQNHYSTVTIEFKGDSESCELHLTQKGVPSSDLQRTKEGWETHYWNRITAIFGWRYEKV